MPAPGSSGVPAKQIIGLDAQEGIVDALPTREEMRSRRVSVDALPASEEMRSRRASVDALPTREEMRLRWTSWMPSLPEMRCDRGGHRGCPPYKKRDGIM